MGDDSSPEKKENKFPKNRSSPLNRSLSRGSKTGSQQSPQEKKIFKFILLFYFIFLTYTFFNYNHMVHSLILYHFSPRPVFHISLALSLSAYYPTYFLKVHLHPFSKIKSHKKSQNSKNQGFSYYYFCLMIAWSGSGSRTPKNIPCGSFGFGSGSRRPKNIPCGSFGFGSATLAGTCIIYDTRIFGLSSMRYIFFAPTGQEQSWCEEQRACRISKFN